MDKRYIKVNRIFILTQIVLFIVDVILSYRFDISIYFMFMWVCGLLMVVFNAAVQTLFYYKVIFKNNNYSKIIRKHSQAFSVIMIYRFAKNSNDILVKTVLKQGFYSTGVFVMNFIYVIVFTMIVHPENIGFLI